MTDQTRSTVNLNYPDTRRPRRRMKDWEIMRDLATKDELERFNAAYQTLTGRDLLVDLVRRRHPGNSHKSDNTDPRYPNGQCDLCGWGSNEDGTCPNTDCPAQ